MTNVLQIVAVDAHGNAAADHDRVLFTVVATVTKLKLPDVKAEALDANNRFKQTLKDIQALPNVEVDLDTLVMSTQIVKNQVYDRKKNEYVEKGYKAVFTAAFESKSPTEASAVYDLVTDLDGFEVQAPVFKLKHQEGLKRQALEDAHKRLMERFEVECRVMGVDRNNYEVSTWNVNYGNGGHGHLRAMSAKVSNYSAQAAVGSAGIDDDGEEIQIQAGKAIVTVYLNVSFARKQTSEIKE